MLQWHRIESLDNTIEAQSVIVWLIYLPGFYPYLAQLYNTLNASEKSKANRFHFEIHQQRYTISQGLLRFLLSRYLKLPPQEVPIATLSHGKPFIPNQSIHFNISHSNDYAIFGFSYDTELGIDIEFWRERKFIDGIIDSNFSPLEQKIYHSLPKHLKLASFYQGWTCNEAYIKAIGLGLSMSLQEFSVEMDPNKAAALLEIPKGKAYKTNWTLHKLPCPENYSAAIATANTETRLILCELEAGHL